MEELKIIVNQELGVISTNFDEIRENLTAQMEVYKQLEVTESNKTDRKKDISTLRKISKSVNEKRIEVKNECLKPYQIFEEKAKELIEIINQPIFILDNQVKEFEEKQRFIKIDDIGHIYSDLIGDLIEFVSLDMIYDSKWENVSVSMKSIKDELISRIESIKQDVTVIKSMVSDKTAEALEMYWVDLSLSHAIATINSYEEYKKKIIAQQEENQRKEKEAQEERDRISREREIEREREKAREDERAKIREEERIKEENRIREEKIREEVRINTQHEIIEELTPAGGEPTMLYEYRIELGEDSKQKLELFMDSVGIEWEEI